MAIPACTQVFIIPFQVAGCLNNQGKVVKVVSECCCDETGNEFVGTKYLVRYKVENCHECEMVESWFCEPELSLTVLPNP